MRLFKDKHPMRNRLAIGLMVACTAFPTVAAVSPYCGLTVAPPHVYPGNYTISLSASTVVSPLYFQPVLTGGPYTLGAVVYSQAVTSPANAAAVSGQVIQKGQMAAASAYYLGNLSHASLRQHVPVGCHVGVAYDRPAHHNSHISATEIRHYAFEAIFDARCSKSYKYNANVKVLVINLT